MIFWLIDGDLEVVRGSGALDRLLPRLANTRHLYVVAGGHSETFDLSEREHAGRPLGTIVSMTLVPSASTLLIQRPSRGTEFVVVSDPEGNLPHARAEVEHLRAIASPQRVLAGPAASLEALEMALLDAKAIHFAGHGVSVTPVPVEAHLRLAHGERFGVPEVFRLSPRLQLAVLNGCSTGRPSRAGSLGLPQSLLQVGTRTVLSSVARVDDDSAARFVKSFYDQGGLDRPADAYRLAAARTHDDGDDAWRDFRLWGRPAARP